MAYKDFVAGATLTASEVDTYLMRQTVMTFASAAARDAALSGVLSEGMVAYLQDANAITYYNGVGWQYVSGEASSFTPSWTNLTVGSGAGNCAYGYVGAFLWFQMHLVLNGTTVSANPAFAIPGSRTSVGVNSGSATYIDDTVGQAYTGGWFTGNGGTNIALLSPAGYVTGTVPFTWANNDSMLVSGLIRVA